MTPQQTDIDTPPPRAPWRNIMLLVGLLLVGMSVGSFLVIGLLLLLNPGVGLDSLQNFTQNPQNYTNGWWTMMLVQVVSHLFTFLIPALVYWRFVEQQQVLRFFKRPFPTFAVALASVVVVLAFMPFDGWVISWNSQLKLPAVLQPIEAWMQNQENTLARLTEFMTTFSSIPQLLVALFVVALIPAIGEEVLFRAIIQRKIFNKIHNIHIAIWLSAAVFSAIHLQFYGFVPRMLLGAMFGYLYVWSGNLWVPILAHFVNNAATLIIVFLHNKQKITFDATQTATDVPVFLALSSLVFTIAALYYIRQITFHKPTYNYDS